MIYFTTSTPSLRLFEGYEVTIKKIDQVYSVYYIFRLAFDKGRLIGLINEPAENIKNTTAAAVLNRSAKYQFEVSGDLGKYKDCGEFWYRNPDCHPEFHGTDRIYFFDGVDFYVVTIGMKNR